MMRLFKVIFMVLLMFQSSCLSHSNGRNEANKMPVSVNIILTKALDMRCQYDYAFGGSYTTVECVNEKNDTCNEVIENLDSDYFLNLAQEINKLGKKTYEFEDVDDGEFLKVSVNWGDSIQTLIIRNFPVYVHEPSNALANISGQIDNLYKQLDSNRCW